MDYRAIIADLRQQAQKCERAAEALEALSDCGEQPTVSHAESAPKPKRVYRRRDQVAFKPQPKANSETLSALIRQVAAEPVERTAIEIVDRIREMRPNADRTNLSTMISQQIRAGNLVKTDDLKVRPVSDGVIQRGHRAA